MAMVAAIMSTTAITPPTTPPMIPTVLSELDGVAMDIRFPGRTGAVKIERLMRVKHYATKENREADNNKGSYNSLMFSYLTFQLLSTF